jgi:hypothetical protein
MCLCLKGLKNSTKNHLDTINFFTTKLQDTKSNYKKSVAFLFTNNEQIEKEYRKIIASKKCLGINLTKDVKYLCKETYKLLMKKKPKETTECGKISHAHGW